MTLADISLMCPDGSVHLHDVRLTYQEFTALGMVADLFRDAVPHDQDTPALLVMRAPLEPPEYCNHCGQNRPERKKETNE